MSKRTPHEYKKVCDQAMTPLHLKKQRQDQSEIDKTKFVEALNSSSPLEIRDAYGEQKIVDVADRDAKQPTLAIRSRTEETP